MRLLLLLLLFVPGLAMAQTTGLCSAIADRAARMECLGRPPEVAPAPPPLPAARPAACTPDAPCTDRRGRYYTTRSGAKRYISRR